MFINAYRLVKVATVHSARQQLLKPVETCLHKRHCGVALAELRDLSSEGLDLIGELGESQGGVTIGRCVRGVHHHLTGLRWRRRRRRRLLLLWLRLLLGR